MKVLKVPRWFQEYCYDKESQYNAISLVNNEKMVKLRAKLTREQKRKLNNMRPHMVAIKATNDSSVQIELTIYLTLLRLYKMHLKCKRQKKQ